MDLFNEIEDLKSEMTNAFLNDDITKAEKLKAKIIKLRNFENAVKKFADEHGVYEGKIAIEHSILNNVEELKTILNLI